MSSTDHARPGLLSRGTAFLYDPVLARGERKGMAARRRELLREARGRVLELGAGTGLKDGLEALVLTGRVRDARLTP